MNAIRSSGRGGGRSRNNNDNDDDDECLKRKEKEIDRCYERKKEEEYAHPDFLGGCKDRATDRWRLCIKNGGRPDPNEPNEWSLADDEIWLNIGR
jgi:hypothetical protein